MKRVVLRQLDGSRILPNIALMRIAARQRADEQLSGVREHFYAGRHTEASELAATGAIG